MSTTPKQAMRTALVLARRGMGAVHPNPPVGAVVVKDGVIVGAGWHHRAGEDHAEIIALKQAGNRARGADLFVTLEPCAHQGKTPPCAEAIAAAGIRRVFLSRRDSNPVSGHGAQALQQAGLEVHEGFEARRAAHLLAGFQSAVDRGRPRVALKLALSLDGRLASGQGDSRWISNDVARAWVHRRRREADAVMIGAGTALKDNPVLTARVGRKARKGAAGAGGGPAAGAAVALEAVAERNPDRIVVDSHLRVPASCRAYAKDGARRIVIATDTVDTARAATADSGATAAALNEKGVEIWRVPADARGQVDLNAALAKLGEEGYTNILCEGGGQLSGSLIREQLADVLYLFIAPQLLLGADGPSWTEGVSVPSVARAVRLAHTELQPMAGNWLVRAVPEYAQWSDPASVDDAAAPAAGEAGDAASSTNPAQVGA